MTLGPAVGFAEYLQCSRNILVQELFHDIEVNRDVQELHCLAAAVVRHAFASELLV